MIGVLLAQDAQGVCLAFWRECRTKPCQLSERRAIKRQNPFDSQGFCQHLSSTVRIGHLASPYPVPRRRRSRLRLPRPPAPVHLEPRPRRRSPEGGPDAGPAFDDHAHDGPVHAPGDGRYGRGAGQVADYWVGWRSARKKRGSGDRNGRIWGAHSGAVGCRKWCQTARIARVADRAGLHRSGANERCGNEKPRRHN